MVAYVGYVDSFDGVNCGNPPTSIGLLYSGNYDPIWDFDSGDWRDLGTWHTDI